MKISIIIPVYNAEGTLSRCLGSVEAQSHRETEVVIVDDHGSDGSMELARSFARKSTLEWKFVHTEANCGPGGARNAGIAAASGEYLAFVDADDELEPDFCSGLLACAGGADLAHCDIRFVRSDGSSFIRRNPDTADKDRYLRRFTSYFYTYVYRRDLILAGGIRFPSTLSAEDSCFLICCLLQAESIKGVAEPLYVCHLGEGSLSRRRNRRRGLQRLASFRELRSYARRHGLRKRYGCIIDRLCIRKGLMLAIKDFITG